MAIVSENKNLSENAKKIFEYIYQNDGSDFTAADIATAVGLNAKQVNGSLTMTFQCNKNDDGEVIPLIKREEAIVNMDGSQKVVKFIKITDEGREYAQTIFG